MKKRMLKQIGVIAMSAVLAMPTTGVYAQQVSCDTLDVQQEEVTRGINPVDNEYELSFGEVLEGCSPETIYDSETPFIYYKIYLPYSGTVEVTCTDRWDCIYPVFYSENHAKLANQDYDATKSRKLNAGTYYIGVCSEDEPLLDYSIQATYSVPATDLELSESRKTLKVGEECSIDATVSPDCDATDKRVKWSVSGNKKAVVVDENGNVKAKQPGIAKVCAQTLDGSKKKAYATIVVKPKKTANLSVVKQGKGSVKAAWAAQSGVTGYQIQYGTDAQFSKSSKKFVTRNVDTQKLNKKTYYVRVRAYVFDSMENKKYYGAWSSVKKVNVK